MFFTFFFLSGSFGPANGIGCQFHGYFVLYTGPKLQRKPPGWRRGGGRAYNRRRDMRARAYIPYTGRRHNPSPPRHARECSHFTFSTGSRQLGALYAVHLSCSDVKFFCDKPDFETASLRPLHKHAHSAASAHVSSLLLLFHFFFCTDDINYSSHLAAHKYHPGRLI